ncbi:MAG: zinc ribbon domain-containing protein [Negativicutes bacterium]|nr:zinc ribbon domain-containing protein [Negativicutes bacterium]
MAFCNRCGEKLPEGACFCSGCGIELLTAGGPKPEPPWETCEVGLELVAERWGLFPSDMLRFIARAEGPAGIYTAGTSPAFKAGLGNYYQPDKENHRHTGALAELETMLIKDGWEQTERGREWFGLRFRRRARSADAKGGATSL